jgi:hypothetical protein
MFTLEYAKDPVYLNDQGTFINLTVKFAEFDTEMPFGATPDDYHEHGREIFERAKAGEFGEVAPYVGQRTIINVPTEGTQSA